MSCLKNYKYAIFIMLFHGVAVSASPDIFYGSDQKDDLSQSEVKPTLSWERKESEADTPPYCLTPSDPGCANMWQKEKEDENKERIQNHQQKKFYKSLK
jgi:hypothetical protein